MPGQGRTLQLLLLVPLYFATMVLFHELGHALTAKLLIPGEVRLYVWPGYELFPDLGRAFPEPWPENIPAMTYVLPEPSSAWMHTSGVPPHVTRELGDDESIVRKHNIAKLMGSTTTLLLSFAALALIALLKPKGFALWCLAAGALLHLDILTGTVMPFFDARHLVFIGSETPEALDALWNLGVPRALAAATVITLSALELVALYGLVGRVARD